MTAQKQSAMESMIEWLAHEDELGKAPSKIECVGEFDLHDMHYYIFKFKASTFGKWLLGVCGGYENLTETTHCGHVFSELEPYDPATAEQNSIEMVEMIREYWMKEAAAYEAGQAEDGNDSSDEGGSNIFNGFVLLNSDECDLEQIKHNLLQDWGIAPTPDEEEESGGNTLVFEAEGFTIALSFINAPVPDGEAEHFAGANFFWPEAVEVTKTHVSQIILAVFSQSHDALDTGIMYTMLASSSLKLPNAIGLYSSGTVYQPEAFIDMAQIIKEDNSSYPLLNLVYFGIVRSESGVSGYTYGLKSFGKKEIEIIDSAADSSELYDFLIDISSYVLQYDVTLRDGETIGFTEDQKLPITQSKGVYIEGDSLKIGF
ncbi:DUF4261 domain-containing protein [Paenibacillus yanchengensis]|uniref:DUF4261 domain-containing protein n=1 Tax=Paenibacillus yanchengensis TaxID=2035833 RepID=A0ABW4YN92_9BACL